MKFSSARLCFCILGRCEVWWLSLLMDFVAAAGAPRFSVFAPNLFLIFFGGWCDRCSALTSFKLNTLLFFCVFSRVAVTKRSNSSLTKDEISAFWRSRQRAMEEHLKEAAAQKALAATVTQQVSTKVVNL